MIRPLLKPHLDDLDKKIQPGMLMLTWQSMNIDGYLQRIHQVHSTRNPASWTLNPEP